MSGLKTRSSDVVDTEPVESRREEGGAGVIMAILACVVLMLLVGGALVGLWVYSQHQQQLAFNQERIAEFVEAERMRTERELQQAQQEAFAAAEMQAESAQGPAAPLPVAPPPAGPSLEEQFQAEIEPLNKAVEERPDDPKVWQDRGRVLQRWRKWQEAAEDYDRFLELNPNSVWMRMEAAVTRFAIGDYDAYQAHCQLIEERLAMKTEPTIEHNRAARVLSLREGALTKGDFFLVMAQDQPLKNPGKWWLLEPMLALQYRTGRYEEALKTLDEVRMIVGGKAQMAATEIWAAMLYHQLGRADDARRSLTSAQEIVASGLAPPGTDNAGGDAVIMALFLVEEARSLIEGGSDAPTPAPETQPAE